MMETIDTIENPIRVKKFICEIAYLKNIAKTKQKLNVKRLAFYENLKPSITLNIIILIVSNFYDVDKKAMLMHCRKRELCQPRQICHYLAKIYTSLPGRVIGLEIGGFDHATILNSNNTVKNLIETDKKIRGEISDIRKIIENNYEIKNAKIH